MSQQMCAEVSKCQRQMSVPDVTEQLDQEMLTLCLQADYNKVQVKMYSSCH